MVHRDYTYPLYAKVLHAGMIGGQLWIASRGLSDPETSRGGSSVMSADSMRHSTKNLQQYSVEAVVSPFTLPHRQGG